MHVSSSIHKGIYVCVVEEKFVALSLMPSLPSHKKVPSLAFPGINLH